MSDPKRIAQLERTLENLIATVQEYLDHPRDDSCLSSVYYEIQRAEETLAAPINGGVR